MDLMRPLARAVSSTGKWKYGSFLASVHWEVITYVIRGYGNDAIFHVGGCNSTLVPVAMFIFLSSCIPRNCGLLVPSTY
jgi:hypothetical protein